MEYDIKYENDIERVIGCIPKVEELKEKVILSATKKVCFD